MGKLSRQDLKTLVIQMRESLTADSTIALSSSRAQPTDYVANFELVHWRFRFHSLSLTNLPPPLRNSFL